MEELKNRLRSAVSSKRELIEKIVRSLHQYAETGLAEKRSSALLTDILADAGFSVSRGLAGMPTAFSARIGSGFPHLGLIAEMDALPGLGHACGHNIIAAAAVGAALGLQDISGEWHGTLSVFGTPAEEQGLGKIEMLAAGNFDGVDFAMMVHPSSTRQVIKEFLGLVRLGFTFYGRAAHAAAYPEEGVNALDAVIQTFNAVNALRQQLPRDVRVHGIITNGGAAPNIIPAEASCLLYIRAKELSEVEAAAERVRKCAEGAALATGCRFVHEQIGHTVAPMNINRTFAGLYSEQLHWLGLQESDKIPSLNAGSSDIGNLSQAMPVIHPHVPLGENLHIHTPEFAAATVSDNGLKAAVEGAHALALSALALYLDETSAAKVLLEFAANKKTN